MDWVVCYGLGCRCEGAPRLLIEQCIRSSFDIHPSRQILCLDCNGVAVDILAVPNNSRVQILDLSNGQGKKDASDSEVDSASGLLHKESNHELRYQEMLRVAPPIGSNEDSISDYDSWGQSSSETLSQPDRPSAQVKPKRGGRLRSFSKAFFRVMP